jgi:hypothetical protein
MVLPLAVPLAIAGIGAIAGGAAGAGLGRKKAQYATTERGYQPDYRAPNIGGTERLNLYTNVNQMSDEDLIAYIASGQAGPELQARYRELGQQYRPLTPGTPSEYVDENGVFHATADFYSPNDPYIAQDKEAVAKVNAAIAEEARAQLEGQDLVTGYQDVGRGELWGQQDRDVGGQILQKGFDFQDRAPVQGQFGNMSFESGLANTSRNAATAQLASQVRANAARTSAQTSANQLGTDYDRMVAAYGAALGQQAQGIGQGNAQLGYMQDVMLGRAGPSLAEQQSNRVLGDQISNQMAMAKSGPGFSPAAQREAAVQGSQMQDAQRMQLAELRAAEQLQAQQEVGRLIGQQQAAGQAFGSAALGGANQLGGLSATRTGLAQNLYGQDVGLYGMERSAAQNQYQMDLNRLLGMTGYDISKAQTSAGLSDAQRARDDAMRQYYGNLGTTVRGQGYTMAANQAQNNLALEQLRVQANQGDLARGAALDQFNVGTYNANRPNILGGIASGLGGLGSIAGAYAGSSAGGAGAAPAPQAAYGPAYSAASSNPQGWNYASDERSKEIIDEKTDQVNVLLNMLAKQQSSSEVVDPWAKAAPKRESGAPMSAGDQAIGKEMTDRVNQTLTGLGAQPVPEWKYTPEARATNPAATGPGPRVGYTTRQLKESGPVGKAMVKTDPSSGLEVVDGGAATSFSLAGLGELQRQNEELRKRLEALEAQNRGVM